MKVRLFFIMMAWCLALCMSEAQPLRVSFVNFYPGSDIYELEGHSVLRLTGPSGDVAISYGTFDFNAPNFVYRYVKGETDYWVSAVPWIYFEEAYRRQGRRIVEHQIDMDSVQIERLQAILAENFLPENSVYRYNYVKDNCSLRPLRVLQQAMGDSIMLPAPQGEIAKARTYRQVMRYYHKHYPWYQFGIDLALGSGIDQPINDWDMAFAPVVLDTQLDGATSAGKKLVKATRVIYEGHDATLGPTPWYLTPMAVALAVLALGIALTIRDVRRCKVTRWFDTVIFSVFGLTGLLLTFLIFVSTHEATSPNWLYLWLNPLCLIVPIFIWLKNCNIVVYSYQIANFALIMALAIAWPWIGQSGNPAFVPLILCDAMRAANYIYVYKKNNR